MASKPWDSPQGASLSALLAALDAGPSAAASEAVEEIIRRFRPLVLAYWMKQRLGEYEDFLQDVLLALFRSLPNLKDHAAFPGFFRRIVIATAVDHVRSARRDAQQLAKVAIEDVEAAFDEDITTRLVVRSLLDRLPDKEREVLEKSYLEDLDSAAIGQQLGMAPGAVRTIKSRAINKLRHLLSEEVGR